jgi:hypothetical protein
MNASHQSKVIKVNIPLRCHNSNENLKNHDKSEETPRIHEGAMAYMLLDRERTRV